jgi:OmpA-OmpF porin, OOP family
MKKLAAMVSASLILSSAAAMADGYVGGKFGKSWLDDACTSTQPCDDESAALGLFAGYKASDYVSIEAGYDYLGQFTVDGLNDDKTYAFTLAPKFTLPLNDVVGVYAKLGTAYVDYGSKNDMSYLGAAGLEFAASNNVKVRLEHQILTDINTGVLDIARSNTTTLGVAYEFGAPAPVVVAPVVAPEPVKAVVAAPVIKTYKKDLSSESTFAVNSAVLKSSIKSELKDAVTILKTYPQAMVKVTGHTDSTGSDAYNMKLSDKRAQAVANAIVAEGVDADRITVKGAGETQPVATNKTAEGRAQNRRVEIIIPTFEYQMTK